MNPSRVPLQKGKAAKKQINNPSKLKGYIEPEIQTPKLVITKKSKLEHKEVINTFLKLIFFKKKKPIKIIIKNEPYCHKKPG